jgi:hypothetical protein
VLRLGAIQFVLGVRDLGIGILDGGFVLFYLQLQLGDFQSRKHLVGLHARSVIDVELFYVAGFFGIDVDLLEWNQLGRKRQRPSQGFPLNLNDADRNFGRG